MWLSVAVVLASLSVAQPAVATGDGVASPPAPSVVFHPWSLGLELGLDVPGTNRLPMASTRVDLGWRTPLGRGAFGGVALRTGYSYVAGEQAVADPVLGTDAHALLMAHRIPMRAQLRLGLKADGAPVEVGVQVSGGADVAVIQAQSFGRQSSSTAVMPGLSAGGFMNVALGESVGLGALGEWDSATADLAAGTPGLSGDLSAIRIAVVMTFVFG